MIIIKSSAGTNLARFLADPSKDAAVITSAIVHRKTLRQREGAERGQEGTESEAPRVPAPSWKPQERRQ